MTTCCKDVGGTVLRDFLQALFQGNELRVGRPRPISSGDKAAAADWLVEFERQYRLGLPGDPPALDLAAALWSAESVCLAAALIVHRDDGESVIRDLLAGDPPDRSLADTHYAVDLSMRFLPSLLTLSRSAAADDPLVRQLMKWATAWPLSSVGVSDVEEVDTAPLRTSPVLMRLYADRVVAAADESRVADPAVAEMVRQVIGDYSELCPRLASVLPKHPTAPP